MNYSASDIWGTRNRVLPVQGLRATDLREGGVMEFTVYKPYLDGPMPTRCYDGSEVDKAVNALEAENTKLKARCDRLEYTIRWALGENEEFTVRGKSDPAYWWRRELRRRLDAAVADEKETPNA